MAYTIRVVGHALTCCPACQTHLKVAAGVREMACPFCGAELVVEAGAGAGVGRLSGAMQGVLAKGRRGLLAASLLGLSFSVTACYGGPIDDPITEDATMEDGDDDASDSRGGADGTQTSAPDSREDGTTEDAPKSVD